MSLTDLQVRYDVLKVVKLQQCRLAFSTHSQRYLSSHTHAVREHLQQLACQQWRCKLQERLTWSKISELPSARITSMRRQENAAGKGQLKSVRNHCDAYSTGTTLCSCQQGNPLSPLGSSFGTSALSSRRLRRPTGTTDSTHHQMSGKSRVVALHEPLELAELGLEAL